MSQPERASLDGLDVRGRRVFLRVDFNVPLLEGGGIRDDARMRASLPTLRELLAAGAAVIVATHLGRPMGRRVPELSTKPLADHLSELLGSPVQWVSDCVGPEVEKDASRLGPGEVLMLENLRFHPEEEANDPEFAGRLAQLADLYVSDAFGSAHRAHASTEGAARRLPAYPGRLMARELEQLGNVLGDPARPMVAIMGGSKLSSLLGGAMAATFLRAHGLQVGRSLVEQDFLEEALQIMERARTAAIRLELPVDVVVAPGLNASVAEVRTCGADEVGPDEMILDLGPKTVASWAELVASAGTVVWNGPLGAYENPLFASATRHLAEAIAASPAVSITGGGDLQAAIEEMGLERGFTHVSTGGGATLEFLEGKKLPGVEVLKGA